MEKRKKGKKAYMGIIDILLFQPHGEVVLRNVFLTRQVKTKRYSSTKETIIFPTTLHVEQCSM